MIDKIKNDFLVSEMPGLMKKLNKDMKPKFGIMTPQHMVEHLIITIKSTAKKYDLERENPPNKRQAGFKRFISKGCVIEHRPHEKTIADLPPLKYDSLEEAVAEIPNAVQRFYSMWENESADYIPYNPFMGELTFEELEIFHYNHFRYHLWQFGLLEQYP